MESMNWGRNFISLLLLFFFLWLIPTDVGWCWSSNASVSSHLSGWAHKEVRVFSPCVWLWGPWPETLSLSCRCCSVFLASGSFTVIRFIIQQLLAFGFQHGCRPPHSHFLNEDLFLFVCLLFVLFFQLGNTWQVRCKGATINPLDSPHALPLLAAVPTVTLWKSLLIATNAHAKAASKANWVTQQVDTFWCVVHLKQSAHWQILIWRGPSNEGVLASHHFLTIEF